MEERSRERSAERVAARRVEDDTVVQAGQNLMFVEDAGRKLKQQFARDRRLTDFWVRVDHHESLHAHDAVGVFTRGVEGGYPPAP